LSFKILKLTPVLTVGKLDDQNPGSTVAAKKIQALVKIEKGDGTLTFEPALPQNPIEQAGIHSYTIYLAEGPHYNKSDEHVLTFRILMTAGEKANAIASWKKDKDPTALANKHNQIHKLVTQGKYSTPDEVVKALNSVIGAPERHTVWSALGYTLTSGGWTMD